MKHTPQWISFLMSVSLVACGSSGKNEEQTTKQQPNVSFFQFKAEVSGLQGNLVLSNNGKNNVTIDQNGSITFPTTWTHEGNYELKIMEEPCAQRCVIDQPTGTIATTGSLKLNINCESKRWDVPLSDTDAMSISYSEASHPSLSMNRYGDSLLTWFQSDGFNDHLYKKEFINRKWSNLNSIVNHFSFDGSHATDVSVALSDNMESGIVWAQETSTDFFSIYLGEKMDTSWDFSPSMLNVGALTASEIKPVVRVNAVGEKIVVWSQAVGSSVKLFKAEYKNGNWTLPTSISDRISVDGSDVKSFDAAINDLGEIVIVWNQTYNDYLQAYKAELRNGYAWDIPTGLQDNLSISGTNVESPRVTINNAGDAYVVWYQKDAATDGHFQIFVAQTHDSGQSWDIPDNLDDNLSTNNRAGTYPKVVVNDQGQAVIMYRLHNADGIYQSYVFQRASSSATWTNKRLSVADFAEHQGNQAIDMDEFGNVVAAWSSNPSGNVYKAERRNGSWVLAQETAPINSTDAVYNLPAVAVNNCRSTIAWQQEGVSNQKQVFIQQYR